MDPCDDFRISGCRFLKLGRLLLRAALSVNLKVAISCRSMYLMVVLKNRRARDYQARACRLDAGTNAVKSVVSSLTGAFLGKSRVEGITMATGRVRRHRAGTPLCAAFLSTP